MNVKCNSVTVKRDILDMTNRDAVEGWKTSGQMDVFLFLVFSCPVLCWQKEREVELYCSPYVLTSLLLLVP
jgi:hypothetical protein